MQKHEASATENSEADEMDFNSQTESTYSLSTSKWAQTVKLYTSKKVKKGNLKLFISFFCFFKVPRPRNSKPRYSSSLWLDCLGGKGRWKKGHCSAASVVSVIFANVKNQGPFRPFHTNLKQTNISLLLFLLPRHRQLEVQTLWQGIRRPCRKFGSPTNSTPCQRVTRNVKLQLGFPKQWHVSKSVSWLLDMRTE